jgi:hypothetical protein
MSDDQKCGEILREIEELCDLHGNAICDFRKCREFNNRLSALLRRFEEMECYKISDRLMDALLYCSPKTGAHCENAYYIKSVLERIKDIIRERHSGCE